MSTRPSVHPMHTRLILLFVSVVGVAAALVATAMQAWPLALLLYGLTVAALGTMLRLAVGRRASVPAPCGGTDKTNSSSSA